MVLSRGAPHATSGALYPCADIADRLLRHRTRLGLTQAEQNARNRGNAGRLFTLRSRQ
jgi:hypothetical protein